MIEINTRPVKVRVFGKLVGPVIRFAAAAEGEECYDDIGSDWNFLTEITAHVPAADADIAVPRNPVGPRLNWSIVGTPDEFKLVKAAPKPKVTLKINPPSELRLTCPLCRHEWGEPLSRIP